MKVFISHPIVDENLATTLKKILEESEQIDEAYIARRIKNYNIEISEKIIKQIDSSDCVVAIITKNTQSSASVNQELGYAQGKEIPKIPMIEKNAIKGIFVYGKDVEEFTQSNFEDVCKTVRDQIIQLKTRKKSYTNEELFIQKSAQFRYDLFDHILFVVSNFSILFNTGYELNRGTFAEESRRKEVKLLLKYVEDKQKLLSKLDKLSIETFSKIGSDYKLFKNYLDNGKRFPHSDLLPEEQDGLMKLNDRILEINEEYFDMAQYIETLIPRKNLNYNDTFEEVVRKHPELPSLPMNLRSFMLDLKRLVNALCETYFALENINTNFGNLAFKSTFDYDDV